MSEQTLARARRAVDLNASMPWLLAAAIYLLLLALGPSMLADPDTYSHIALGRWIIEHRAVPSADPFSETMRGVHWVAFEWLSQIAYASAHAIGGWVAVVALAAAAAATAFGLLARFLQREWRAAPIVIAVLAALVLTAPHILARPHMLALPLIVTWVAALIRALDSRSLPPWRMIALMTLWANLHGSFTFGLAMIGPVAVEAWFNAAPSERGRTARQWAMFGLGALAAACVTPYGPEMILVTVRAILLGDALTIVSEWRPQDFSRLGGFEIVMLAGIGLALYRGVKLPLIRIVMLLGVLHLGLSQSRHAELLATLAPIFIAAPLARQFSTIAAEPIEFAARSGTVPLAAGLVLIAATGMSAARGDMTPPARNTPARALASFEVARDGPLFNDYDFGAYLDFAGVPPFVDGREELYGRDFLMRYHNAVFLQDLPDFLRLLDDYRIGVTLLKPTTPAVAMLDRLPGWQRVYADNIAVVHRRR